MLISRSSCWNWLSRSGKVLKRVFVSKRQKKEPEKSRPPALSCWYWSPVAISAGFQLFCIYSRSERESSDPSSPALTMTKSSLSTVCWTSRALARFPLACTHPKLKPPHLWMMGAALMWKTQQKVKVYVIFLYKLHPLPHHHLLFFVLSNMSNVRTRRAAFYLLEQTSVSSDGTQLDRGPGSPSQLRPWSLLSPSCGTGTYNLLLN